MKKILLGFMLAIASISQAAEPVDTIVVDNSKIIKVIEHPTTNTKGKKMIKYYFLYDGELVPTSKSVVEKYKLCKSYNARIALIIVKRKNHKRIIYG